eukprot:51031-Amphidinium_carterae.1
MNLPGLSREVMALVWFNLPVKAVAGMEGFRSGVISVLPPGELNTCDDVYGEEEDEEEDSEGSEGAKRHRIHFSPHPFADISSNTSIHRDRATITRTPSNGHDLQ